MGWSPAWEQTADFEEGDTSDFDSVVENGASTLTASVGSVKNGNYGVEVDIDGSQNTVYGALSDPAGEIKHGAETWIDPNTLTMGDPEAFPFLVLRKGGAAPTTVARVNLAKIGGAYKIMIDWWDDGNNATSSSAFTISDAYHKVRVIWVAASAPGANDGIVRLFVDDEQLYVSVVGDTDTLTIEDMVYGAWAGLDAGTSGTFYLDDCQWVTASLTPSSLAGALTSAGGLVKIGAKALVGILTTSGTVVKRVLYNLAGTLTSAGTIAKKILYNSVGTLTSAGAVIKKVIKEFTGAVPATTGGVFGGTLTKKVLKPVAGVLNFIGIAPLLSKARRWIIKLFTGAPTGNIQVNITPEGIVETDITPSGSVPFEED